MFPLKNVRAFRLITNALERLADGERVYLFGSFFPIYDPEAAPEGKFVLWQNPVAGYTDEALILQDESGSLTYIYPLIVPDDENPPYFRVS